MCPWSDNWWIEEDKAWFCGGEINALFCVDMDSCECELVSRIPECTIAEFRLYSYCLKHGNSIFCLPSAGDYIWIYDLKEKTWEKIVLEHKEQIFYYQKNNNQIFFWDYAGYLYMMDLDKKNVSTIFHMTFQSDEMTQYVIVDNKIYHVRDNRIICLDLYNDDIQVGIYEIPYIKAGLFAICYDGSNFWLSGHAKEVCIWSPDSGVIKMITNFPEQFGFYHFRTGEVPYLDCKTLVDTESAFFEVSVALGEYIWFIPDRSSDIIYINKETHEVFMLEVEDEQETKESIEKNYMGFKYLLQYVRENRYIGVYSFKNQYIFEIDTVELCIIKKNYSLSNKSVMLITNAITYDKQQKNLAEDMKNYDCHRLLKESRERDQVLFFELIKKDAKKKDECLNDIGRYIYHSLNEQ